VYEVEIVPVAPVNSIGTKGVPRPDREAQILRAATDHFAEHGFAGSAMADIAQRAGISKPLIYQYFGSKEHLYGLCLDSVSQAVLAKVDAVVREISPNLDGAVKTLHALFEALEGNPQRWLLIHDPTLPSGSLRETARKHRDVTARLAADGARDFLRSRGNDDPDDASALTFAWMGIIHSMVRWWIEHPDQSAEQMTQRSVRLFLAVLADAGSVG